MKKDPWRHLDEYPPWFCRLMARRRTGVGKKSVKDLSDAEIAIRSGTPVDQVRATYNLRSWAGVPTADTRAFFIGVGFDPMNGADRNRAKAYAAGKPTFAYLKSSPYWESIYLPLIQRMRPKT